MVGLSRWGCSIFQPPLAGLRWPSGDRVENWGWTGAVHPDDLNTLVDYWRTVIASSQPGEIEARLRRFDGVYRWFLFRATPSFDDKGSVTKWYGTNTDIDDRKKAEQALIIQNNRLQLLLKLTNRITSKLDLREVLRAITATVRELTDSDAVTSRSLKQTPPSFACTH